MSDNPFQSPQSPEHMPPGQGNLQRPPSQGRSYINQIPVVASLILAQGVLLLLYALVMGAYAVFFNQMDGFMPPNAQVGQAEAEMQEKIQMYVSIGMGIYGGVILVLAMMHFIAAYLGFQYKGRVFGIVTLIMGFGSVITCYCAPTAIGLAIYGLIVYLHPAVAQAFEMGKSGMKKQEILARFPY